MEIATIKTFGKVLKQEFRPPEDLPFRVSKAFQALTDLPVKDAEPAKSPQCPLDAVANAPGMRFERPPAAI